MKFKPGSIIRSTSDSPYQKLLILKDRVKVLSVRTDMVRTDMVGRMDNTYTCQFDFGDYWVLDEEAIIDKLLEKYSK